MTVEVNGRMYREAWEHHKNQWRGCTKCPLHSGTSKKVLVKGMLPCDVLFIGESPDILESVIGIPFSNPAGKVMDSLIEDTKRRFTYAFTNVIACPSTGDEGESRPPTNFEAEKCSPRLYEVLMMARPKGVVLLGRSAQSFAISSLEKYKYPYKHLNLSHPSHIMGLGGRTSPFYEKELKLLITFLKRILDEEENKDLEN
jgi:uracil-DNA glycosylase family 4|tara:strand:- start:2944 stop:3543 length:600 start_codon:yes stop_codon:yes gene_type:complete